MAAHSDARLNGVQGKGHAARFASCELERKELAVAEIKRQAGQIFATALVRAAQTPKEAADRMEKDASAISRLLSGMDVSPTVAAVILDHVLRRGLVIALDELPDDDVIVNTVVTIGHERRRA